MLHIHTGGRRSGKTTWLYNLYKKNPGMFITPTLDFSLAIKPYDLCIKIPKHMPNDYPIYIDEIALNLSIEYDDIIRLSNKGHNIYITGLSISKVPSNFLNYLKINYPEHTI